MPERVQDASRLAACFGVRTQSQSRGWQALVPEPAEVQLDIKHVLLDVPELLGAAASGSNHVAIPSPNNPQGPVLIAVSDTGGIALVGCAGRSDVEAARDMVADILTATGSLWHLPYERFAAAFGPSLGRSLEDYLGSRAENWSAEDFRQAVERSLGLGRFPVLLVGQEPGVFGPEVVGFLRSMQLEVVMLEFRTYRSGEIEIVLPVEADVGAARSADAVKEAKASPAARPTETRPRLDAALSAATGPGEKPTRFQSPWPKVGTKPGVMAGKRPPPPEDSGKGR